MPRHGLALATILATVRHHIRGTSNMSDTCCAHVRGGKRHESNTSDLATGCLQPISTYGSSLQVEHRLKAYSGVTDHINKCMGFPRSFAHALTRASMELSVWLVFSSEYVTWYTPSLVSLFP